VTIYYVSTTGSNSGSGGANSPWRTITKAMRANLQPGDEVVVKSGTYNEAVYVNKNGKAGDYITIRSEVPGGAKIVPTDNKAGILIDANYVTIDGFDVSRSKVGGITGMFVHHVNVTNNTVHDNVSNGIFLGKSEFLLVEGNAVYGNSAKGGSSGIHIQGAYNVTGSSSTSGYRIIVRDNVSYENKTKYGATTDGNGISFDNFRNTNIPSLGAYKFKTLVEGNIVYSNTGRGIQIAFSDYTTVRDNISYHNNSDGKTGPWKSELANMASSYSTWTGNIAVTDAGNPAISNTSSQGHPANKNVAWSGNTTWNGTKGADSVHATAGNSKPSDANNKLGVDPGLSLAEVKAMGAALTGGGATAMAVAADAGTLTATAGAETSADQDAGVRLDGGAGDDELVVSAGSDELRGGNGADRLRGAAGSDLLVGANGADHLSGGAGRDVLAGGAGRDVLVGGGGVDTMVGGAGEDIFVFGRASAAAAGDVVEDFSRSQGDRIDLRGIDADTNAAGNQSFSFIGSEDFSGDAGELQYRNSEIAGDVDGDKTADFHIEIANHLRLVADDFIL
jgi:parallel beta-helix repeat protein